MEISQLCKSTHITISCSNPYPCGWTYMPGQYILGQIKAGFEISADPPVCNRQKCFPVEKIKTLPACLSYKL